MHSTREAANFYYEVVSRGRVVFSDFSHSSNISFETTPLMAPSSRLLVYQILPNSEVAADYIPFDVEGDYPQSVSVAFSQQQVKPGDAVDVQVQTQGPAKVGLVAVDRSVFILAENRLNLQQVFDELERLYMQPQAELHEATPYEGVTTRGAQETFQDAGLLVLSNKKVPEGKKYESQFKMLPGVEEGIALDGMESGRRGLRAGDRRVRGRRRPGRSAAHPPVFPGDLAMADRGDRRKGNATLKLTVPDSITTWMLRAVAISKDKGLGVAETAHGLPAVLPQGGPSLLGHPQGRNSRSRSAAYNYLDQPQSVVVSLDKADWFDMLGPTEQTVRSRPETSASASFTIRPKGLGFNDLKVTARSTQAADAVVQSPLVQPEGVPREVRRQPAPLRRRLQDA